MGHLGQSSVDDDDDDDEMLGQSPGRCGGGVLSLNLAPLFRPGETRDGEGFESSRPDPQSRPSKPFHSPFGQSYLHWILLLDWIDMRGGGFCAGGRG